MLDAVATPRGSLHVVMMYMQFWFFIFFVAVAVVVVAALLQEGVVHSFSNTAIATVSPPIQKSVRT